MDNGGRHHGAVKLGAGKRSDVLDEQRNDGDVTRRPVDGAYDLAGMRLSLESDRCIVG
jgi:hypothetical protein